VVVENLLPPGGAVLIPGTGHFSESWAVQTEALGRKVVRTPWHPGWPIDNEAITQALRDDPQHQIVAVFAVHTDTASGITSDMAAIRSAIDAADHPALLVVDAVASLGCTRIEMDALGANVVLGGVAEGADDAAGRRLGGVDARATAVAESNPAPRYYWDWRLRQSPLSYRKFCGTPPQTLMAGLAAAFDLIEQEGEDAVHARHARWPARCRRRWAPGPRRACWTSSPADPASRSVSGDDDQRARGLRRRCDAHSGAQPFRRRDRRRAGSACRARPSAIGHLGDSNAATILGCLGAVEAALRVQGVAIGDRGLQRAVERLVAGDGG